MLFLGFSDNFPTFSDLFRPALKRPCTRRFMLFRVLFPNLTRSEKSWGKLLHFHSFFVSLQLHSRCYKKITEIKIAITLSRAKAQYLFISTNRNAICKFIIITISCHRQSGGDERERLYGLYEITNSILQWIEVILDDVEDGFCINLKIAMSYMISGTNNISPRNFRPFRQQFPI